MSKLPVVAILGRPNVGKSSLFNRLTGKRTAVVSNREGVTRDRHFERIEWDDVPFDLVDTGGYLPDGEADPLAALVRDQIYLAIRQSDVVLFMVDGRVAPTYEDMELSAMVRKSGKPMMLLCNKTERPSDRDTAWEYMALGIGEPLMVSAAAGTGISDMMTRLVAMLPEVAVQEEVVDSKQRINLAVLGRPNVGKSTLVNKMLGEDRQIVSDIPGTTRDAIDNEFDWQDYRIVLTDTAGLRKKAKVQGEVEYFSNQRSLEAIRRSDVCVLVVDSITGMEIQEYRIIEQIRAMGKGLIILLNKWDLVEKEDKTFDHFRKAVIHKVPDMAFIPFLSVSALKGQRVHKVLEMVTEVYWNSRRVIGREPLIEMFLEALDQNPHPIRDTKKIKMTRICQIMTMPIVVAIEVTHPMHVDESWKRYFLKRLYDTFPLQGAVVKLNFDREIRLRKDEEMDAWH
jgi:GTPase